MNQEKQKKKPRKLANIVKIPDNIVDEVNFHEASTEGAYPVDSEWLLLAEFSKAYGWQAYLDAKNDARDEHGNLIVTPAEFLTLIEANRKLEARDMIRNAQAVFVGSGATKTKNPSSALKSMLQKLINYTKADE